MPIGWFIVGLDGEMLLGFLALSGRFAFCFAMRDGTSCRGRAGSWTDRGGIQRGTELGRKHYKVGGDGRR